MIDRRWSQHQRLLLGLSLATAAALFIIGVRFMVVPQPAAQFFGITAPSATFELHYVIGLRDMWLGLLLAAVAIRREWGPVALWLGFGAIVCFSDAVIVALSSGQLASVVFHVASGVFCTGLGIACRREARRA